jgi:hypothetical protein
MSMRCRLCASLHTPLLALVYAHAMKVLMNTDSGTPLMPKSAFGLRVTYEINLNMIRLF